MTPQTSRGRAVRGRAAIAGNDARDAPSNSTEVSAAVSGQRKDDDEATTSPQSVVSKTVVSGDRQSPATGKGPARGYSWDPFVAGNTAALTHGAFSARLVLPLARQIVKDLRSTPGLEHLQAPLFADRLQAYATAEASARLIDAWVGTLTVAEQSTTARTDPPLELLRQAQTRAGNLAARIGLYPQITDDVAADIVKALTMLARRAERRAERKQWHEDLVAGARKAWYPDD